MGAISGGLGAGTSAIMSGAELTVGRVMAVKAMNMVSDATVDTVVYAYHSNKYDKDFTGGDIVKTWVKSAATSFAMQSVVGGKSSSKTETSYGQTYRVRVHNVDPSAPVGSNAYNGWVVRVQRGRRYFDPTINDFREAKYFNPNGPDYDEVIINDTHIPILDPYQN